MNDLVTTATHDANATSLSDRQVREEQTPASGRPGQMLAAPLSAMLAPGFCIAATDYPATNPTDATLSALSMQPYSTLAGLLLASSVITLLLARLRLRHRQPNQAALEQTNSLYQGLVEDMRDGVAIYDAVDDGADFVFVSFNPTAARSARLSADQVIGRRVRDVFPMVEAIGLFAVFRRVYRSGQAESHSTTLYEDDRVALWVENYVFKLPSGEVVAVFADVSEQKGAEQALLQGQTRLEQLAYYDALTGLPNRRLLLDRLGQAIAVADRTGTALAVCYLDLGYQFFDPAAGNFGSNRKDWAARIGQALQDDELCLVYQPIVNMRDGEVAGMEALVRWRHPDRGLLLPSAFLPIIEGTELIRALDRWVLQRAIADLADWLGHGLSPRLHVNLSAHSLLAEDFIDVLQAIFDNTPSVTGDQLSLEILETAALKDLEAVTGVIRRCNDLGLRFALDDFGTGYSSLTYFRHLPADILKIDQSFVCDMLRDQGALRIVESVIGMARAFDRTVVAEGVESEEHGTMLLRFGCELGQGYGIARPMPSEQVAQWLRNYQHPRQWRSASARVWRQEDLPLLTMEAEHRGWVERLIQQVSGDGDQLPVSIDDRQCCFGRWYQTDGMRQYGHMDAFKDIDALHQRVHKLGDRLLHRRANDDPPDEEALEELRMASNALIDRLTMLQNAVIESHGATEPNQPDRRPRSKDPGPLDLAAPDWASPM